MGYREEKIEGMRDTLDFLEENPVVPLPYFGGLDAYADTEDGDDISIIARAMKPVEKITDSPTYFRLQREFGPITLSVNFPHEQVCEKVVVRTELVPAQLIDAYEKEIVEWKCPESILNIGDGKEIGTEEKNEDADITT